MKKPIHIPKDLAIKSNLENCTLVPVSANGIYYVTCKFLNGKTRSLKFKISSDEAKAFIDLLMDDPDGIFKPWVIAKKGKNIGLPTKQDFRLAQFNSTIKKTSPIDDTYGSKDFWRFFIVPQKEGASNRKVKLCISKKFISEIK